MAETSIADFFTKRHKRLIDVAKIARIVSWILFVFYILWAVFNFLNRLSLPYYPSQFSFPGNSLWNALTMAPLVTIHVTIDSLSQILTGAVYFICLQGISMGLSMIVETSLNYKENSLEGQHE
jgi:hypothetical protein